jgi:hypothetical protein
METKKHMTADCHQKDNLGVWHDERNKTKIQVKRVVWSLVLSEACDGGVGITLSSRCAW